MLKTIKKNVLQTIKIIWYNTFIRGDESMNKDKDLYNKSNTLCVRLSRKDLQKLEYLRIKLDIGDHSKLIRLLIEKEFNKL